jgi:hypothetical protein
MQDLHEKNRVYEKRISDLEKDNTRLEDERRRLTDDPAYFEKVAREKMGIIRDGEVIYKVVSPGQKKGGPVSEESSFIIKQVPDESAEKPKAAGNVTLKAATPKQVDPAKSVKKNSGSKVLLKKSAKVSATKSKVVKKSSKTSGSKPKPDAAKE